ncbi:hypothetical protein SLEP1_g41481 [Rubroshorea leprosula]|uniref:Transmembrane protein n=1 Tax=Rubroshorea leprosula TaxID=152421 RepID=A0AAV5L7A5_9ROSI|nr:hypothetical protein SLEP1_g41481 [Rubroshorea leprosula]
MATTCVSPLAGLVPLASSFKRKSHHSLPFAFSPSLPAAKSSRKSNHFHTPSRRDQEKSVQLWRIHATSGEVIPVDSTPLENSEEIVSASGDDGVATIISALLFLAFVALSILTIGVIYLGVQDFLRKREREKFEKEAATQKSGKKKKVRARARTGPRGFGQKIDEYEDED